MLGETLNTDAKRTIAVFAALLMALSVMAAVPVIGNDAEDEEEEEETTTLCLGGVIENDTVFPANQIIIVNSNLTIKNGARVEVNGSFIVNDNVTAAVEGSGSGKNSQLLLKGDVTINGSLVTKTGTKDGNIVEDAGLIVKPSYKNLVTVNGLISATGDASGTLLKSMVLDSSDFNLETYETSRLIINGQLSVGTNVAAIINNAIISEGAVFENNGSVSGSINLGGGAYFKGSVFVSDIASDFKITLSKPTAEVSLVDVEGSNPVRITDLGMWVYKYGGIDYYIEEYPDNVSAMSGKAFNYDPANQKFTFAKSNVISFSSVTNVKVTETIVTGTAYNTEESKTRMYVDPTLSIGALDKTKMVDSSDTTGAVKGVIAVEKGKDTVLDSMSLSDTRIL